MSSLRPERDVRRKIAEEEKSVAEDRDYADWIKDIGPEDMDRERVVQNLEGYGWEIMDEDVWVSNPTTESDMPDWVDGESKPTPRTTANLLEERFASSDTPRPVEDEVTARVDGDAPDDAGE